MRAFPNFIVFLSLILLLSVCNVALGSGMVLGESFSIEIPGFDAIQTNPAQSRISVGDKVYSVIDGGADLVSTIQAFDRKSWSFYEMRISPQTLGEIPGDTISLLIGQIQFRQIENCDDICTITVLDGDYENGQYTVERRTFPTNVYQEFIYLKKNSQGEYQDFQKLYLIEYSMNGRQRNEYAVVSITQAEPPPTLTPMGTVLPASVLHHTPTPTPTSMVTSTPDPTPSKLITLQPLLLGKDRTEMLTLLKRWLPFALGALALLIGALLIHACRSKAMQKKAQPVRFFKLSRIDARMKQQKAILYDEEILLDQLCERFRNFAASELNLYYDVKLIRLFIAGLAVSRLTIMQGISGTGKTSLAYACGKFFANDATIVPVQPSWRDRSDLLGYFNEFSKKFNETSLLEKLYEANYTDDIYVTVLDEMNIARVEYYFAEFLSILEIPSFEEWMVTVVPDEWKTDPKRLKDGKISLPRNMWYIGTANNDDSTFAISDKVYDRAMVIDLDNKAEPFTPPKVAPVRISANHLLQLFDQAQAAWNLPDELKNRISQLDHYLMAHLRISFGNRIMRQLEAFLPVYLQCGGEKYEALDYVLCKKVLRKLENQNLMLVRDEIDGLCDEINRLFGIDTMRECLAYLQRLKRMG